MSKTKRRPTIILDAGYVSIKTSDRWKSSKIIGLHGVKLFCVIVTVLILFFISCLNLTCIIWIMYKLDWSPFYKNGSKVFRYDKINHQIELYHQATFQEIIYTTKIDDYSSMNISAKEQIDIYGDHNSIIFENNQIAMNTEYFYMNNRTLVDFDNLHLFKFDKNRRTRVHLDRINSQRIHSDQMNLITNHNITISDANYVLFAGQNVNIISNRFDRQSIIYFNNNNQKRKHLFNHRHKGSHGNLDFRINSIFLDLPKQPLVADIKHDALGVYRVCICNTTFLLLRSFAHQPCPLC